MFIFEHSVNRYFIPNLANGCRVLKLLSEHSQPWSVARIARELEIPRTTCLRIVETLAGQGFLEVSTNGCTLGIEVVPLGMRMLGRLDVAAQSGRVLEKLMNATGETSHVAVWNEGRSLILKVCDSAQALRAASRAGSRAHAHCSATGKVLLAWNHAGDLDAAVPVAARERRTPRTLVATQDILRDLKKTLRRGFAVDNEEYHPGVRCVAAPVRDAFGQVNAAVGITGVSSRLPDRRLAEVAGHVVAAAEELSLDIGWRPA